MQDTNLHQDQFRLCSHESSGPGEAQHSMLFATQFYSWQYRFPSHANLMNTWSAGHAMPHSGSTDSQAAQTSQKHGLLSMQCIQQTRHKAEEAGLASAHASVLLSAPLSRHFVQRSMSGLLQLQDLAASSSVVHCQPSHAYLWVMTSSTARK